MRIMIDTNVLISMIFFPSQQMNELKSKLCNEHSIVLCSHIVDELQTVTERKFPARIKEMDGFFESLPYELVYTPKILDKFPQVRDKKDTPILAAAITTDVDVLITGDGDFSEIEIERPEILTPSEFVEFYM